MDMYLVIVVVSFGGVALYTRQAAEFCRNNYKFLYRDKDRIPDSINTPYIQYKI